MKGEFRNRLVEELPNLRNIVQKISYNQGIADDLFQECCIRIIEKEDLCNKEPDKISNWMSVVTRNTTLTLLKRGKKVKEGHSLVDEPDMKNESLSDFSEEHIRWLVKEFEKLNTRHKQILKLRYCDQMKLKDIGEQLGISHSTVIDHINRALSNMKKSARKQGLMTLLLPWNWNLKAITNFLYKLISLNAATETLSVLAVLSAVAFLSVKAFEYNFAYTSPKLTQNTSSATPPNIIRSNNSNDKNQIEDLGKLAPYPNKPFSLINQILKESYSNKYRMAWMDKKQNEFSLTPGSKQYLKAFVVEYNGAKVVRYLNHGIIKSEDPVNLEMLSYGIPDRKHPIAILEFISSDTNKLITEKFELNNRGAGTVFQTKISTSENVKAGTARMIIYYPGSPLKIQPSIIKVKVEN